jgi:hypothetical protein
MVQHYSEWKDRLVEHLEREFDRLGNITRSIIQVSIEERLPCHAQREVHHGRVHVHNLARRPLIARARRVMRDQLGVGGNPVTMKRWLHESPLTKVQITFARQQPVTEEDFCTLERPRLGEVPLVGHEHIPDVIRVGEHDDALWTNSDLRNVTVASHRGEEAGTIAR